jgi:hypothetical protein
LYIKTIGRNTKGGDRKAHGKLIQWKRRRKNVVRNTVSRKCQEWWRQGGMPDETDLHCHCHENLSPQLPSCFLAPACLGHNTRNELYFYVSHAFILRKKLVLEAKTFYVTC